MIIDNEYSSFLNINHFAFSILFYCVLIDCEDFISQSFFLVYAVQCKLYNVNCTTKESKKKVKGANSDFEKESFDIKPFSVFVVFHPNLSYFC